MRIAHIITRMIVGGAQENTLASVAGLRERHGVDAWLVTGAETGPEGDLLADRRARDVPVVKVPRLVRSIAPARDLLALVDLWRVLRRMRPSIVHTHSGKAGVLGRLAARLAGVPRVVHTLHGSPEFRDEAPITRFLFRLAEWLLAWITDDLVGVCRAMVEQARRMGLRPRRGFAVIYSGFDVDAFAARAEEADAAGLRRRLGIPAEAFVLAAVARLVPLKGHRDLFRAAERLDAPRPWVLLVGDGPLRESLAAEARAQGLDGRLTWAGRVPPDEVAEHIRAADCVVHASYREGLARVLPQALLCGRPVVAYAFDGAPEVVAPGETGWCVRPGDVEALAAAIREVAASPERAKALAQEGARRAAARFRAEAMIEALMRLYRPRG